MRRAILVGALALVSAACSQRPTQILVHVDSEPDLKQDTQSLLIRVWGRAAEASGFNDANVQYETAPTIRDRGPEGIDWPWVVDLRPLEGDTDRVWRIEASAYSTVVTDPEDPPPTFLAVARASASYQEGAIQHVFLLLRDACRGVTCEDPSTTCAATGRCEQIGDPVFFDPDAGLPDAGVAELDAGPDECTPSDETCDGVDEDCDGEVDEDFDLMNDETNCGACGTTCDAPNTTQECVGGTCSTACIAGFYDCSAAAGCETTRGVGHCSGCGAACDPGDFCTDGLCTDDCLPPGIDCDGSCVDVMTDTSRCGGCDVVCPTLPNTVNRRCSAGLCRYDCASGFADCNGDLDDPLAPDADGCEVNLTLRANCGSCGNRCADLDTDCARYECGSSQTCEPTARTGPCEPPGPCATGTCRDLACMATCVGDAGVPTDAGTDGGGGSGDGGFHCGSCAPGQVCSAGGCEDDPSCGGCSGGELCCGGGCCPTGSCSGDPFTGWSCSASVDAGAGCGCSFGACCGSVCCDGPDMCVGGLCGDPCGGCGLDEICCDGFTDAGPRSLCCQGSCGSGSCRIP